LQGIIVNSKANALLPCMFKGSDDVAKKWWLS